MKKLALILSVIMIAVSSVMPVFAQPSINVDGTVGVESAEGKDGSKVEIILGALSDKEKELVKDILKKENLKKLLGSAYSDKYKVIDSLNVKIVDGNGKEIAGDKLGSILPAFIKFTIPGVKVNSNVKVLYYKDGQWHVADNLTLGADTVAGVFDQSSPFIFLVEGTPTMVSPQTGYNNMALYMSILASISITTIIVLRKKKMA